jgi:membrane protease YdiL (CAAX protease family)
MEVAGKNLKEGDPRLDASASSLASADTQRQARRGLTIYFAVVVVLTALFDVLVLTVGPSWIFVLMWSPAAASVVARLVLREGFADVSFRFGGRRTLKGILLALVFPIVIGPVAYGIAWATGLAQFDPQPLRLVASFVGDTASPVTLFVVLLALTATIGSIIGALSAAGEEIGWRGYMLMRLIDAGVPRPVLASGLIWGLWHIPLVLAGVYVAGSSPVVSAVLLMVMVTSFGFVFARMRLETGSIWPAIALHGAWNSIVQGAFDPVTTGAGATLWVGEAGILTALAMVVAAVIFSRGHWTMRRVPEARQETGATRPVPQT